MKPNLNDLHDYTLVAWSLDQSNWMMIFDIKDPMHSVRQEFSGVIKWYAEAIRSPLGVLEMNTWQIETGLLANPPALKSWTRIFGFVCSADEIFIHSRTLIDEHKHKLLVSFETVDGGTLDLICNETVQR